MLYVNDEIITADKMLALFGASDLMPKNKDSIVFEQTATKPDRNNPGHFIYPQINETKYFEAIDGNGIQYRVRHSVTAPRYNPQSKLNEFTDSKYLVDSHSFRISTKKDRELAAFFLVNPVNIDSPLREYNPNKAVRYKTQNLEKLAEKKNQYNKTLNSCLSVIFDEETPIDKLSTMAAGMGIFGTTDKSREELQDALSEKAQSDPNKFKHAWASGDTRFKGIVNVAIDKGILVKKEISRITHWYIENEPICIVPAGSDDKEVLISAITDNFDIWFNKIDKALKGVGHSDHIEALMGDLGLKKDHTTEQKVLDCIKADVLYFDRGTSEVYTLKEGEKNEVKLTVKDKANWLEETVAFYDKNKKSLTGLWLASQKKQKDGINS